jgi:hypothetical protein
MRKKKDEKRKKKIVLISAYNNVGCCSLDPCPLTRARIRGPL